MKKYPINLPSLSVMITVVTLRLPAKNPMGSPFELIVSMKFSLLSSSGSSNIEILNEVVVIPTGNTTWYGPGA